MLRSKLLWAFVLAVLTSMLLFEARTNLVVGALGGRLIHAVAAPGTYIVASIHTDIFGGHWPQIAALLAFACNFLVYLFFWYACIWIIGYLRSRQHPYERQNTLVPPGI